MRHSMCTEIHGGKREDRPKISRTTSSDDEISKWVNKRTCYERMELELYGEECTIRMSENAEWKNPCMLQNGAIRCHDMVLWQAYDREMDSDSTPANVKTTRVL